MTEGEAADQADQIGYLKLTLDSLVKSRSLLERNSGMS